MLSFWNRLPKPFLALAPMEDVTDTVFRQIVSLCGRPDVMFTEFTNCEGLQSVGQTRVIHRLKYDPKEQPLVAQVWGITPEDYYKTAQLIQNMGFTGIDINMGCPVKKVIKMGACSALIKNHSLAKEIVLAVKEGAPNLPVSIKTRIGFASIQTEEWLGFLLRETRPAVLTIHGRTVKEESKVPCHWDEIGKVVKIRDEVFTDIENKNQPTLIVGNGDIASYTQAINYAEAYNLDGIMIGRGVFKNPWIFNPKMKLNNQGQVINDQTQRPIEIIERLKLLETHLDTWQQTWGKQKNYAILKKYFKIYISGYHGSSELRAKLMETQDISQAKTILQQEKEDKKTIL
ncbi:MAG: tRNA-dihydrouridine synthase [Patescibacteria group bacterium]